MSIGIPFQKRQPPTKYPSLTLQRAEFCLPLSPSHFSALSPKCGQDSWWGAGKAAKLCPFGVEKVFATLSDLKEKQPTQFLQHYVSSWRLQLLVRKPLWFGDKVLRSSGCGGVTLGWWSFCLEVAVLAAGTISEWKEDERKRVCVWPLGRKDSHSSSKWLWLSEVCGWRG